jgi:hypothetical protein
VGRRPRSTCHISGAEDPTVASQRDAGYARVWVPLAIEFPDFPLTLTHREQGSVDGILRVARFTDWKRWRKTWRPRLPEGAYDRNWPWANEILASRCVDGRLCIVVVRGESLEAMLSLNANDYTSRLEPTGRPIMYVEYVSTAPWNDKSRTTLPLILAPRLGRYLLGWAVQLSREHGLAGRIGLHAEQTVASWYSGSTVGLTKDSLRQTTDGAWLYFEGDERWAQAFTGRAGQP